MFLEHLIYISPESYDLGIHSKKSDIWELGILLYFAIVKESPYDYGNDINLRNSYEHLYRRNKFKYLNMEKLLNTIKRKNMPDSIYILVCNLLKFNDADRLTIEQVLDFQLIQLSNFLK